VGGTNETLADDGPVGVATMELHGPGAENVTHGTPGQFSNAAFFQRTLSSSRLKVARLVFISFDPGKFCCSIWPCKVAKEQKYIMK
jgi:hypothetical protein